MPEHAEFASFRRVSALPTQAEAESGGIFFLTIEAAALQL
jgi:hypothetical protein